MEGDNEARAAQKGSPAYIGLALRRARPSASVRAQRAPRIPSRGWSIDAFHLRTLLLPDTHSPHLSLALLPHARVHKIEPRPHSFSTRGTANAIQNGPEVSDGRVEERAFRILISASAAPRSSWSKWPSPELRHRLPDHKLGLPLATAWAPRRRRATHPNHPISAPRAGQSGF